MDVLLGADSNAVAVSRTVPSGADRSVLSHAARVDDAPQLGVVFVTAPVCGGGRDRVGAGGKPSGASATGMAGRHREAAALQPEGVLGLRLLHSAIDRELRGAHVAIARCVPRGRYNGAVAGRVHRGVLDCAGAGGCVLLRSPRLASRKCDGRRARTGDDAVLLPRDGVLGGGGWIKAATAYPDFHNCFRVKVALGLNRDGRSLVDCLSRGAADERASDDGTGEEAAGDAASERTARRLHALGG